MSFPSSLRQPSLRYRHAHTEHPPSHTPCSHLPWHRFIHHGWLQPTRHQDVATQHRLAAYFLLTWQSESSFPASCAVLPNTRDVYMRFNFQAACLAWWQTPERKEHRKPPPLLLILAPRFMPKDARSQFSFCWALSSFTRLHSQKTCVLGTPDYTFASVALHVSYRKTY